MHQPRIFDGFLFNDELELLELRLMELYEHVDTFVFVECAYNWQQHPKPCLYADNRERFKAWSDKISDCQIMKPPMGPFPIIEHHQRQSIAQGFQDATPLDVLMIGDADEIPNPDIVERFREFPPANPFAFSMDLYYYYVNCKRAQRWNGTIAMPGIVDSLDCQAARDTRNRMPSMSPGGWHFSWLGPLDKIQYKLRCHTIREDSLHYSGTVLEPPDADDSLLLQQKLNTGEDLFGRHEEHFTGAKVEIGKSHPKHIREWLERYPQFEWNPEASPVLLG